MERQLNNSAKVLIVDDEVDICLLLSGILKKKNLQPSWANSIKEADKALAARQPAIVFLDNNLPDGYGIDHILDIKREHPSVKVVMITANDTPNDREKAFRYGADFFIGKPFNRETVYQALDNLLFHPV